LRECQAAIVDLVFHPSSNPRKIIITMPTRTSSTALSRTLLRSFQRHPAALIGSALLFAATAQAQTNYDWTSATDGSWGTDTNWTVNGVPGGNALDTATFNTASTGSTITLDGSRTLDSVTFGDALTEWTINAGSDPASILTVGVAAVKFSVTDTTVNFNAALQGTGGIAADLRLSGDGGTVNFTGNLNSRTQLGSLTTAGTTGMIYNLDAADIVKSRMLVGFHNGTTTINTVTGTTLNVNASQTTTNETRAAGGSNAENAGVIVIRNGATWTQNGDTLLLGFSGTNGAGVQHGRLDVGVVGDSIGNLTIGNSGNLVIADRAGSGILNINNGTVTVNANSDTAFITLASQAGNPPNTGGNGTINLNAAGTLVTARNFTKTANGTGTFNFDGGLLQINRAAGNVTTDLFGTGIDVNVQNGGARIDTQANSTVINQALVGVGTGGLEKLGGGGLTLNGVNTIQGDITVSAGTLTLGDTGALTFFLGADTSNRVTGTGDANFDGSFSIDFSGASGTSWNLVNSSISSSYAGFNGLIDVDGNETFVNNAGIWSSTNYTFSEFTGTLTVIPEPSSFAALAGLAGIGLVALRRRRRA
jgi:autotransporter-associated beta strand protein